MPFAHGWFVSNYGLALVAQGMTAIICLYINALDLKAVFHIKIMVDNTNALAYIIQIGCMASLICDDIAKQIWEYAISCNA